MPNALFPVSDTEHSAASVEAVIGSRILTGITKISYGDNLEWSEVNGANGIVVAHARGMYKAKNVELEMYRSQWDALLDQLPANWRLLSFPVLVHIRTNGHALRTDKIVGCRYADADTDSNRGSADPLMVKVPLVARGVFWGGKAPLPGFSES